MLSRARGFFGDKDQRLVRELETDKEKFFLKVEQFPDKYINIIHIHGSEEDKIRIYKLLIARESRSLFEDYVKELLSIEESSQAFSEKPDLVNYYIDQTPELLSHLKFNKNQIYKIIIENDFKKFDDEHVHHILTTKELRDRFAIKQDLVQFYVEKFPTLLPYLIWDKTFHESPIDEWLSDEFEKHEEVRSKFEAAHFINPHVSAEREINRFNYNKLLLNLYLKFVFRNSDLDVNYLEYVKRAVAYNNDTRNNFFNAMTAKLQVSQQLADEVEARDEGKKPPNVNDLTTVIKEHVAQFDSVVKFMFSVDINPTVFNDDKLGEWIFKEIDKDEDVRTTFEKKYLLHECVSAEYLIKRFFDNHLLLNLYLNFIFRDSTLDFQYLRYVKRAIDFDNDTRNNFFKTMTAKLHTSQQLPNNKSGNNEGKKSPSVNKLTAAIKGHVAQFNSIVKFIDSVNINREVLVSLEQKNEPWSARSGSVVDAQTSLRRFSRSSAGHQSSSLGSAAISAKPPGLPTGASADVPIPGRGGEQRGGRMSVSLPTTSTTVIIHPRAIVLRDGVWKAVEDQGERVGPAQEGSEQADVEPGNTTPEGKIHSIASSGDSSLTPKP